MEFCYIIHIHILRVLLWLYILVQGAVKRCKYGENITSFVVVLAFFNPSSSYGWPMTLRENTCLLFYIVLQQDLG